jgi:hypothetical protein
MKNLLVTAIVLFATVTPAFARGKTATPHGNVVHSRRAPVIMHRAVPGGGGVHVYGGR